MVNNEYDPLHKIILGSLFPTKEILEALNLQGKWKEAFANINDQALDELVAIESLLRSFNVEVIRPDLYPITSPHGLSSPPLAPRDWFFLYKDVCLLGNEAHQSNQSRVTSVPYSHSYAIPTYDIYSSDTLDKFDSSSLPRPYFHTANVLRNDKDLFVSKNLGRCGNHLGFAWFQHFVETHWTNTKIHIVDTEEHLDASLFFVRPGLVLTTLQRSQLPNFFKDWQVITVERTDQRERIYREMLAYQWKTLNPIVAQRYNHFLQCNPDETMFSINALSINQNKVIFPGEDKELFDELELLGIECLAVNMRALSFWDSGLHCCTSELDRYVTQ